jgi:hypothetical protein
VLKACHGDPLVLADVHLALLTRANGLAYEGGCEEHEWTEHLLGVTAGLVELLSQWYSRSHEETLEEVKGALDRFGFEDDVKADIDALPEVGQ